MLFTNREKQHTNNQTDRRTNTNDYITSTDSDGNKLTQANDYITSAEFGGNKQTDKGQLLHNPCIGWRL